MLYYNLIKFHDDYHKIIKNNLFFTLNHFTYIITIT